VKVVEVASAYWIVVRNATLKLMDSNGGDKIRAENFILKTGRKVTTKKA
jgi:hypothetical protein